MAQSYVTAKELSTAKHDIYNKISEITNPLEEKIINLEKQFIGMNEIPRKIDDMTSKFNDFINKFSVETERRNNHGEEIDRIKADMVTKTELTTTMALLTKDGKYQKLVGGIVGAVLTFVVLAALGLFTNLHT